MRLESLLCILAATSGVTLDDLIQEATAKTEEEKAEALANITKKMADHLRPGGGSNEETDK